jgi:hypothetical protein
MEVQQVSRCVTVIIFSALEPPRSVSCPSHLYLHILLVSQRSIELFYTIWLSLARLQYLLHPCKAQEGRLRRKRPFTGVAVT